MSCLDQSIEDKPCKPEWQTILSHLVYQDEIIHYKICRKMIITLDRMKAPEIHDIIEMLNPTLETQEETQNFGPNWPKPKGSPFVPTEISESIFMIAKQYMTEAKITELLSQWMYTEKVGHLSSVLEKRHAPLVEIADAVYKFLKIYRFKNPLPIEEIVGLRVALIYRFLSENLAYINIAKYYINITAISKVLKRVVGPANGNGKLGGKSSGLILAEQILRDKKKDNPILEQIYTPKSWFLTSDTMLEFFHYNALEEFLYTKYMNPDEIKQEYAFLEYVFKTSKFPPETIYAFNMVLDDLEGKPIVVRSSSLLEDSFEASFSGKYKSLFISNTGTKKERLSALMNAIAEIYASTFAPDPIEYRKERGLIDFREEMGLLIQEVVGTKVGKYFFPSFAGVAFSNNEFRWSGRIKREDGVARLVAGLGTRAVDRTMNDYPVLISPGQPGLKVNPTDLEKIKYSQQFVDVINLETNKFETVNFQELIKECNGYFPGLEKIVSFNRSGSLIDPIGSMVNFEKEDLVITFNPLIERSSFIRQIREILNELRKAFNCPVDIEFASDGEKLYLLQCRPQSHYAKESRIKIPIGIEPSDKLFSANQFVSNGLVKNIKFIIYVEPSEYTNLATSEEMHEVSNIISRLNRALPKKEFILIGPGRWGSKGDIKLGVPVIYSDINNTAMLIEVARENSGYVPELSFGTHFFQDLVEANIKYLPLFPDEKGVIFNDDYFLNSKNCLTKYTDCDEEFSKTIKLISVPNGDPLKSLSIYMDGDEGKAIACFERH
ncbi:MAG: Nucleotidyltransferase protein [Ignavibacteria bacterium]|nr:Nucleotidyltransferase protein [Ignavibacteria bacterium]